MTGSDAHVHNVVEKISWLQGRRLGAHLFRVRLMAWPGSPRMGDLAILGASTPDRPIRFARVPSARGRGHRTFRGPILYGKTFRHHPHQFCCRIVSGDDDGLVALKRRALPVLDRSRESAIKGRLVFFRDQLLDRGRVLARRSLVDADDELRCLGQGRARAKHHARGQGYEADPPLDHLGILDGGIRRTHQNRPDEKGQ